MAKKKRKKKTEWWYVYRATNFTKKAVYFGASKDPQRRRDGSHCVGGTIALKNWNCDKDRLRWLQLSRHYTQNKASEVAHKLERTYKHSKGFRIIQTAGI